VTLSFSDTLIVLFYFYFYVEVTGKLPRRQGSRQRVANFVVTEFGKRHDTTDTTDFYPRQLVEVLYGETGVMDFGLKGAQECVFYEGAWPEHHCKVAEGALLNETIPKEEDGSYSKCKMYDTNDRNTTTKCTEWEYSDDVGHTIVAEVIHFASALCKFKLCWYSCLAGPFSTRYQVYTKRV